MKNNKIKYCIIPAGGKGSRWLPLSKYLPKSMIPLIDRPTIDWIIKEAIDTGYTEIIIVIDKGKEILKKHLSEIFFKHKRINFHIVYKEKIRGVAEAIFLTRKIIGENPFSMIISDHPCFYKIPPLKVMTKKFFKNDDCMCMVAFAQYPIYNNQAYGECKLEKYRDIFKIIHLCPRSFRKNHHRNNYLRISGRYIFDSRIFPIINNTLKDKKTGDISDWDVFDTAKKKGSLYLGVNIKEYFLDMGTPENYAKSSYFLLNNYNLIHEK